ncbi:MAG: winged helix DNA-binding domain-containing protein [Thermoleophilia bacterium]
MKPDDAGSTLRLRLRAQRLTGPRAPAARAVVERLVGVQAQDLAFARLAFRPRCTRAVVAADVDAALRDGTLVWTWAMRGTLHLIQASDAGWLIGLLGPIFAAHGRPRRLALGLDDARCDEAVERLREILAAEGPQTRAELAERLAIQRRGQAPAHLLAYAAMRGTICRVLPVQGREPTYALLEQRLGEPPAPVEEDEALARLGGRYLAGHGPATAADLAAWSGIGLRRARRALAGSTGGGGPPDAHPAATSHVALLGHFDPYLLGYAGRDLVLDRRHARRIQAGGGFVAPAVLVDGRVAGTWRRGDGAWLEPFEPLGEDVLAAAERERADVERFLAGRT